MRHGISEEVDRIEYKARPSRRRGAEQSEKGGSERCQVTSLFHIQDDSDPARRGGIRSRIAAVVCAAKALGGHLAQAFRTFIAGWLSNRLSNRLE